MLATLKAIYELKKKPAQNVCMQIIKKNNKETHTNNDFPVQVGRYVKELSSTFMDVHRRMRRKKRYLSHVKCITYPAEI